VGTLKDKPAAKALFEALPFSGQANTWGEEVYFEAPVAADLDANPQQVVPPGTICFWVQGGAVALPYGPTPISEGKECRLVTAVNVLGWLEGDPHVLASIHEGDTVTAERAD
jgi:hypothetical protein